MLYTKAFLLLKGEDISSIILRAQVTLVTLFPLNLPLNKILKRYYASNVKTAKYYLY